LFRSFQGHLIVACSVNHDRASHNTLDWLCSLFHSDNQLMLHVLADNGGDGYVITRTPRV
jgi:hypothetical protein